MGIVNVTPDSFSDGGLFFEKEKAIEQALRLAAEGADIIDIGGESTRPGSEPVSVEEELRRVIPVIKELRKRSDILISIDSYKSEVVRQALEEGADIVNDISAFRFDPKLISIVAKKNVPYVLMHMKGTPKTMQINPFYKDLFGEIKSFLKNKIEEAVKMGVRRDKIIIDPGIGFGKTWEDNLKLIEGLSFLNELDRPILIGTSRKSFIGQVLEVPPEERLEGTIASSILAIERGAHILRVHDVAPLKKAITMTEAILSSTVRF